MVFLKYGGGIFENIPEKCGIFVICRFIYVARPSHASGPGNINSDVSVGHRAAVRYGGIGGHGYAGMCYKSMRTYTF